METRPDLSVVVVSYQVRELLDCCLASVVRLSRPRLEVWVVDNASTDGSADWVSSHFPQVNLIRNPENRGFAAANNQALCQATGRYVMLLNPDAEVPESSPNALELLVSFMDGHERAGACGAALVYGDGSFQHSAFRFPSLAQIFFDLFPSNRRLADSRLNGRYPRALYSAGRPFQIDHPLGAAFLVRREAVEQVGWLDEDFFIYVEEIDWAKRIRGAGWEIWCVPSAVILHHEARSTRQFREQMFVELWRARFRLFSKHYSRSFNLAAAELVEMGMRRLARQARGQQGRGEIGAEEVARRLSAYGQVTAMARAVRR